jgi:hypothetical protein
MDELNAQFDELNAQFDELARVRAVCVAKIKTVVSYRNLNAILQDYVPKLCGFDPPRFELVQCTRGDLLPTDCTITVDKNDNTEKFINLVKSFFPHLVLESYSSYLRTGSVIY